MEAGVNEREYPFPVVVQHRQLHEFSGYQTIVVSFEP